MDDLIYYKWLSLLNTDLLSSLYWNYYRELTNSLGVKIKDVRTTESITDLFLELKVIPGSLMQIQAFQSDYMKIIYLVCLVLS